MFSNSTKTTETAVTSASNIIGQGTCLEGDLKTTGNLRVEGQVMEIL